MFHTRPRLFLFSLFVFLFSNAILAQQHSYNYLTVVIEDDKGVLEQVIYYPELSTYEVTSKSDQEALIDDTEPGAFVYQGDLALTIFPTYRQEKGEEFILEEKTLRVYTTAEAASVAGFGDGELHTSAKDHEVPTNTKRSSYVSANNVTATKIVTASVTNPDQYNLILTFSNGITFTYKDGTAQASYYGKPLAVTNKYLIESEFGTAKVSFDPQDGETWWVFEEQKEK